MAYEPVIGIETHVELTTASKMFCGCPVDFGAPPNTNVCPVCLGLPGALPVVNGTAVEYAMRIGLALNCSIADHSIFARVFIEVLASNREVLEGQRLFQEMAARVTWAAAGARFEQVPQYAPIKFAGHEAGDFFFVPRAL